MIASTRSRTARSIQSLMFSPGRRAARRPRGWPSARAGFRAADAGVGTIRRPELASDSLPVSGAWLKRLESTGFGPAGTCHCRHEGLAS